MLKFDPKRRLFGPAGSQVSSWTANPLPVRVTYAYMCGGNGTTRVPTVDRFTLATGVDAINASNLSVGRAECNNSGFGDGTYGYAIGGFTVGGAVTAVADRCTLATSVFAANAGSNLSTARANGAGVCDGTTYGYIIGGTTYTGTFYSTADRVTLATSATGANAGSNASGTVYNAMGLCDRSSFGYLCGGIRGGVVVVTTDRLTVSTSVTAAYATGNLSSVRGQGAAFSYGTLAGWMFGGDDNTAVPLSTGERLLFATGVSAAVSAILSTYGRTILGGYSDGVTYGYITGGYDGGANIQYSERFNMLTNVMAVCAPLTQASIPRHGSAFFNDGNV